MEKAEKAVNKFKEGFNCAQSVLHAYAGELGLPEDLAMKVATVRVRPGEGAGILFVLLLLFLRDLRLSYSAFPIKS